MNLISYFINGLVSKLYQSKQINTYIDIESQNIVEEINYIIE